MKPSGGQMRRGAGLRVGSSLVLGKGIRLAESRWTPAEEPSCTLLLERPNYSVSLGNGTWVATKGPNATASNEPPAVGGAPIFPGGSNFWVQTAYSGSPNNLLNYTAYSGSPRGTFFVVWNPTSFAAPGVDIASNQGIFSHPSVKLMQSTSGVQAFISDGSGYRATPAIATSAGQMHCAIVRVDAGVIECRVDGSTFVSNTFNPAWGWNHGYLQLGNRADNALGMLGEMAAFGLLSGKASEDLAAKIVDWARAEFGVA